MHKNAAQPMENDAEVLNKKDFFWCPVLDIFKKTTTVVLLESSVWSIEWHKSLCVKYKITLQSRILLVTNKSKKIENMTFIQN